MTVVQGYTTLWAQISASGSAWQAWLQVVEAELQLLEEAFVVVVPEQIPANPILFE